MAVRKKGRRKIVVGSRIFVWWAFWELDQTAFDGNQVMIVSDELNVAFHYGCQQETNDRALLLAVNKKDHIWVKCPKFENDENVITPAGVRLIIEWVTTLPLNLSYEVTYHMGNGNANEILRQLQSDLASGLV